MCALLWAASTLLATQGVLAQEQPAAEKLSIEAAIAQALEKSPDAMRIQALQQRARGLRWSGGVRPNPELGFEIENFGGGTPQSGTDRAELTYSLSQKLELGGKRSRRMAVAESGARIHLLTAEALQRKLARDVRVAYLEAVAAERRLTLAREQADLADELSAAAKKRIDAGRESEAAQISAEVTAHQARLALTDANVTAQSARRTLAAFLGDKQLDAALDVAALDALENIPVLMDVTQAPEALAAHLAAAQGEEALRLARAESIPDPTLSVGVRQFRETDSEAFLVGVSIPLPVFDLNRGGREQARAAMQEARASADQTLLALAGEVERLNTLAKSSREQVEHLHTKVLPVAAKAGKKLAEGYAEGRFTLLDVLNGRRTLQEVQSQLLDTQLTHHRAVADLRRLLPVTTELTGE